MGFAVLIALSVFFALSLGSPGIDISVTAPSAVNVCENGTYRVVIANSGPNNVSDVRLNVTMPADFSYDANTTVISFSNGTSAQEPAGNGQYLTWNLSAVLINAGQSGTLNVSENITVTFNLSTNCGALSGQRLKANVAYDGGSSTKDSRSIVVQEGHLNILKSPIVVEAHLGEVVNWTITIENTGTGPAYNVVLNDTLGAGLQLLSIDSPGNSTNWSYAKLEAGVIETVNVSARVIACAELENLVEGRWGCGNGTSCQVPEPYAKGSVKFIYREPRLDYVPTPDPISVPYCGNTTVNITFTNSGDGNATNVTLELIGMPAEYTITNVSGATYDPGNTTFFVGCVENNTLCSVLFDFGLPYGTCTALSGVMALRPTYEDECKNVWAPPTKLISYERDENTVPGISVSKSGPSQLYLGQTGTYNLSVTYTNGSCPEPSITTTITDTYAANFNVTVAGGGVVNTSARTITWAAQVLQAGVAWNRTIQLTASDDPCDCGNVFTNTLTVEPVTDCCGCNLSGSGSVAVLVECFNGTIFTSNKIAVPNPQENCRNIVYTTYYNFTNVGSLTWSDITFTERGGNNQTFPGGSTTGTATFTVNVSCTNSTDITLGTPLNLGFLTDACGNLSDGTTLSITYTLDQPATGSFVDWSDLNLTGAPSECGRDGSFHEAVEVAVGRSDFSIGMDFPNKMDTCGIYNFTITLSKNGPYNGYEMTITYDDTDFRYLGPANISGIDNESGAVQSFEPARTGNNLTWDLGANVSSGGRIEFQVEKSCAQNKSVRAFLEYRDNCGTPLNDSYSGAPLLLDKGDIVIFKTPEVVYAITKSASWKIYVTNKGDGTAYNVTVVDTLESDLGYVSSAIDGSADPGNTTNVTVGGKDIITWQLHNMTPNQQHIIELNATLRGCENRNNSVIAHWGCGGEECQNVSDTARIELPRTWIAVTRHEADLVDDCGANASFFIEVRNRGKTYAYAINVSELLPAGLQYVPGSANVTGANLTSENLSGNPLAWYFDEWEPGTHVTITFNATVTGPCDFSGGTAKVRVNYTKPCGDFGLERESNLAVELASPRLSITKTPAFTIAENSSIVNWTITITSNGDYEARNITLRDVLPTNTVLDAGNTTPGYNGTGTAGDPLVWSLPDMGVGTVTRVNVSARVTSCTDDTLNNATVFWDCCPPQESAIAVAELRTQPVLVLDKTYDLDTCDGWINLTIENEGATATILNITEYLPEGYEFVPNFVAISSNNGSHTITNPVPVVVAPTYIQWNATNIDRIYPNEIITIWFIVNNSYCNETYCKKVYHTNETLVVNYTDSCSIPHSINGTWEVDPVIIEIRVHKEPPTQVVGFASWTINISSYNATAENVTVEDVLGTAFHSITAEGSPTISTLPDGTKKVLWTGQIVPQGTDKWVRRVTASVNESGTVDNNVTVTGYCFCGCIYSMHGDLVYASRLNFTKKPNETLTIGEYANFTLTAEYWGQENYSNVTITDALPQNLVYITSNITDNHGFSYDSNLTVMTNNITYLTWNLGNFTGPKIFTINLTTIVADIMDNQNGTTVWNNAYSVHKNDYNQTFQAYDSAWVKVVEPDLSVNKSVNRTIVVAGDVVQYTIRVNHTANSTHDAYDIWITDTVPAKLDILSNTSTPAADSVSQVGQNFSWYYRYVPLSYNAANPINITYLVRVNESVVIGEVLRNNATLTWTSVNETTGNESYERFGNWTALDDYNRTDNKTVTASTTTSIQKLPSEIRYRTIGESVNFTIVITLPRTQVLDVWVNDTIPRGLIYNSTTFQITAKNDSFTETIGVPNNGTQPIVVRWYLGTVNNTDGTNISINFSTIVADVLSNQNGTRLNNSVVFSWRYANGTRGTSPTARSGNIDLREPDLQIAKQFNVSKVEAGDIINFTIRVNHTSASAWDAYDLWINDTIPAKLEVISCVATPTANQTIDHSWYYARLNRSDNITIVCTARVSDAIVLNETLHNRVNLTWTSTNGTNPHERFGNETPLDDYNETASATVRAADNLSLVKTVNKLNATIGEYLDYTIAVGLPRVVVNNVTINDSLPPEVAYERLLSLTGNNETLVETITGQNISWYLGAVNNSAGSNITIMFRAVVRDILANQDGQDVENNSVRFTGYDAYDTEYTDQAESDTVLIVEPDLQIEKSVTASVVEAGDVVTYTINVSHTVASTADAYDVFVNDTLPDHLAFLGETSTGTFGQDGQNLSWFYAYIPLTNDGSNPVTIKYTAQVTGDVIANEVLRNIVNLTWTSVNDTFGNESHERFGNYTDLDDYNETNSTVLTGETSWSINKTADRANATIGEYVNYTVHVDLPKVHVLNLTVTDVLQQGLIHVANVTSVEPDSFSVSSPNDGSADVTVTFIYYDFNNSAGNDLTITILAIVANNLSNQNGTVLQNTLNVTWTDAAGSDHSDERNVSITVVEPDLELNKTVNVTYVEAGDYVQFNLTVMHTPASTAAAYDLWINDTMPVRTDFVSQISNPPASQFVASGRYLSWYFAYLPLDQEITISYLVRVNESVSPLDILTNNATLTWTSVNGTFGNKSHERFGGWNDLDNYNDADSAQVIVLAAELYKEPDEDRSYWINDSVWYRISLVVPHATILNATVNDTLPEGLIFENATVVVVPSHPVNVSFSEPNDGTQPVEITFDFGNFTNGEIINITFNATVADIPGNYHRRLIVQNFAELAWDDNEGERHNASDTSGNVSVIRLPRLNTTDSVRKIVVPSHVNPGSVVNYTVYINNDGFAPAFNITLTDILPRYVSYINGSTTVDGSAGPDPDIVTQDPNGTTAITWTNLIARLNASETVRVRYTCNLSLDAPLRTVLINNATVETYEDEEGNEYPGASDSAKLTVRYPLQVPVMSSYGLWLLTGLLALVAIGALRRRVRRER